MIGQTNKQTNRDNNFIYIYIGIEVVISVKLFVYPITTHELIDRFASNYNLDTW